MAWAVIIVALIAIFIFVKATNKGQNVWSYVIVVAAIFFLITLAYVSTLPGTDLSSLDGLVHLLKVYFAWLGRVGDNFGSITGNAINLEWGAHTNSTDSP